MVSRSLLWVADKPKIERIITHGPITQRVVARFVAGNKLEDAISAIQELNPKGIGGILDLLGEGVVDPAGARAAADHYMASLKRMTETPIDSTVSVKLTQLGLAFDKEQCIRHLRTLATEARAIGKSLEIDMEQSHYVDETIEVYRELRPEFEDIRLAIQAYLRRTLSDLERMRDLRPKIRLVKGAYAEPEDVAFQKKSEIDAQYRFLIDWLFQHGTDPAIASHDEKLLEHARDAAHRTRAGDRGFEIQMLYGVRRPLQEELAQDGRRVRVYVPFGSAWYPYLMRRIAERPANLIFFLRSMVRG
ncbi:MAG: proline dehydrogenase [Actinomycetota bacterium]|nr:proline dehydrogenase [Actinomycetota bacterium]